MHAIEKNTFEVWAWWKVITTRDFLVLQLLTLQWHGSRCAQSNNLQGNKLTGYVILLPSARVLPQCSARIECTLNSVYTYSSTNTVLSRLYGERPSCTVALNGVRVSEWVADSRFHILVSFKHTSKYSMYSEYWARLYSKYSVVDTDLRSS